MTYIDDENKFEWTIFKMSAGFNELRDLSGRALYVQILLIFFLKWIVQCQVIGYAHLCLALPNAPHLGLPVPQAPFLHHWRPGKRKWTFVNLSNHIPPHSS